MNVIIKGKGNCFSSYQPTVKYENKLMPYENIVRTEEDSQAVRPEGLSTSKVGLIKHSIKDRGLVEPLVVEDREVHDPEFPEELTALLRDGDHRYESIGQLIQEGFWKDVDAHGRPVVMVKVLVKDDKASAADWLEWQAEQNTHDDKICTPNSNQSLITVLHACIRDGKLGEECKNAALKTVWDDDDQELIENCMREYQESSPIFHGKTSNDKKAIREGVFKKAGQQYCPKVKRYNARSTQLKEKISQKFGIPLDKLANNNTFDPITGICCRIVSSNDYHHTLKHACFEALDSPSRRNIIIFHSTATTPAEIRKNRATCENYIKKYNKMFAQYVPAWSGRAVLPELWWLGQIMKPEKGKRAEKELSFYQGTVIDGPLPTQPEKYTLQEAFARIVELQTREEVNVG